MAKNTIGRVFPTKYTESVEIGTFETFNKPSMTEPDNAMSIPEIIARFTRGYGVQVEQHPWTSGSAFEGDGDPNDLDGFLGIVKVPEPAEPAAPAGPAEPAAPAGPAEPAAPAGPTQEGE